MYQLMMLVQRIRRRPRQRRTDRKGTGSPLNNKWANAFAMPANALISARKILPFRILVLFFYSTSLPAPRSLCSIGEHFCSENKAQTKPGGEEERLTFPVSAAFKMEKKTLTWKATVVPRVNELGSSISCSRFGYNIRLLWYRESAAG